MTFKFSCFITGTDTGVGKTLVTGALLHALGERGIKATGLKPVAAGVELINGEWINDDVASLAMHSSLKLPLEITTPYLLREAAAPHIAAELENRQIDAGHLLRCYQQAAQLAEAVVVEGVGGFRVPLNHHVDTADLAAQLQLDMILVVGLRLGCLNHALLTAEAIEARGLKLAGWVANQIDSAMPHQEANLQALRERLPAPLLGVLPWMSVPNVSQAAQLLDFSRLAAWPA